MPYIGHAVADPGQRSELSSASQGAALIAALTDSRSRLARLADGLKDPEGSGTETVADAEGEAAAASTLASDKQERGWSAPEQQRLALPVPA